MLGFKQQPTTHYMAPFFLNGQKENLLKNQGFCLHGKTYFSLSIDYLEDYMHAYKSHGFFGLMHMKHYTHNSNIRLSYLDDQLHQFLERFHTNTSLSSNTILVLYSDHGSRFSEQRQSVKGLLQERNPFFSIYLPPLFQQRYPNEFENLKNNSKRLLTPMDVHATLVDLIGLESGELTNVSQQISRQRGSSLFTTIASDRSCADAGIDTQWCGCLTRKQVTMSADLDRLVDRFIAVVNTEIIGQHTDTCHTLELDRVNQVYLLNSGIDIQANNIQASPKEQMRFRKLGLIGPAHIEYNFEKYFFQVQLKPALLIFEFTISIEKKLDSDVSGEKIEFDKSEISRINSYSNHSFCITNSFPDLRKYCVCKR